MKRFLTLAIKTDGSTEMIHGSEVPGSVQRATVQKYRDTAVPEGVERVEIWSRPSPPIKFAFRKLEPEPPKAPEAPQPPAKPAPAPAKPAK